MSTTEDPAPPGAAAAALAYATDWRRQSRLVGPSESPWALPAADVALWAALLATALVAADFIARFGARPVYVANLVLSVLIALPAIMRRRQPVPSFVLTAAALLAYAVLLLLTPVNLGLSPVVLAAPLALHAVVRWDGRRAPSAVALGASLAGCLVNPLVLTVVHPTSSAWFADSHDGAAAMAALSVLACALAVLLVHLDALMRRRRVEERWHELESERSAARQGAVAEERLQLARELHDLLGHSLTAIRVQASTALAVGGEQVEALSLRRIEETAGSSLAEVRELVRLLRGLDDLGPQTGLGAVADAVARARAAGLDVSAELPGQDLVAAADATWTRTQRLAVVRAVEEGLTNALRHGDGTAALSVRSESGRCVVTVRNPVPDGPAASGEGTGTGLEGLRERLRLAGGSLEAGPGDTGFVLRAVVPVEGEKR